MVKSKKPRFVYDFTDESNRIVFYRGVNCSNYSKFSSDHLPWFGEKEYADLKNWGFNLVRFLVFWEALEPVKGFYDQGYIDALFRHLSILRNLGINVIIDFHQDLFSRRYTGNGFPAWVLDDLGIEKRAFKPYKKWYLNYLKRDVRESFSRFWSSSETQRRYIDAVSFLNSASMDFDNIVGIDIMNEPFQRFSETAGFEKKVLADFYKKTYLRLENRLNGRKLFFEPWIGTGHGLSSGLDLSFSEACGGYIPHYYPPLCSTSGSYGKFNKFLMQRAVLSKAREAERNRSPLIFGEFGISENVENYKACIRDFRETCEEVKASWVWWSYDKIEHSSHGILGSDGSPRDILKEITHIYPVRISGRNPEISRTPGKFHLSYNRSEAKGPTEIYIPPWFDYAVDTDSDNSSSGNIVKIFNTKNRKQTITFHYKDKT